MAKLIHTPMMKRYLAKFMLRVAVFLGVLSLYVTNKNRLVEFATQPVWMGITPLHVLWVMFMGIMLAHLFPKERRTMAIRKARADTYMEVDGYPELELYRFIQEQNVRAWQVMLLWLSVNACFGLLYLLKIMDNADLIMLTVFYFLMDYICILFYCPFQSWIMKNKCCVNCRIYDWGHFMMFTPMLFIRNFFSWSLFFTSIVVLIHWEIIYAKHPERFWSGSNGRLQCVNCCDKTCQIKKKIAGGFRQ